MFLVRSMNIEKKIIIKIFNANKVSSTIWHNKKANLELSDKLLDVSNACSTNLNGMTNVFVNREQFAEEDSFSFCEKIWHFLSMV